MRTPRLSPIAVATLAITLAACGRFASGDPTPEPTPFMPVAGVAPLGGATDEQMIGDGTGASPSVSGAIDLGPTATALVATLTAMAASAGASAAATTPGAPPPFAPVSPGMPAPTIAATALPPIAPSDLTACPIVASADIFALAPAPEAPEAARTEWAGRAVAVLTAEVQEYSAELKIYRLRAVEPAADYAFLLLHTGEPLPIEKGRTYRFTTHNDVPGAPPAGAALRIDDVGDGAGGEGQGGVENGVGTTVFLGVSVRETDGADARLLGGDRAGFAIRQQATRCLPGGIDSCGFELRAAPIEVRRGDLAVTVTAGETGVLPSDPPYEVKVLSSHYRRWVGNAPCPDPTDWVVAYRITRGIPATPSPAGQ